MKTRLFPRRDWRLSVFATGVMAEAKSANGEIKYNKIKYLDINGASECVSNCESSFGHQIPCRFCGKARRLLYDDLTFPLPGLRLAPCECMGLNDAQTEQVIAALRDRPRHPATGIGE